METPEEKQIRLSGNKQKDTHSPLSFRHFVLGAIAIFFYVGVEVGIPNIANLYMTTYTPEQAQLQIDEYEHQQKDAAYMAQCVEADMKAFENKVKDYDNLVVTEDQYNMALGVHEGKLAQGLGLGAKIAGWLIGLYWLMMLVGRLIGGSIAGKVSSKRMLTVVSILAIVMLLSIIFIPTSVSIMLKGKEVPIIMVIMFLCGLCTSVMWSTIFNLSVEGLGKYTPAASGIFMVLVCGGGILPFIQGVVADFIGYTGSYVVAIVALLYILFYALIGSKNVNKDIKVD
jgi:FHS family L-fucose permease-like MFS transporter